ncbi:MAG: hypothetical protein NXY57DRAFT_1008285 [Lentinula lateritia]|uniref:Uncharacterized protein n=1 Tax=Lentinula lateritia TaxID=40482 RepID=A0ABQ8VCA8_9AGAR|nr:MAG: hypothetical protein NXY57DRAFT_1008285 [Lentinula lateritia]KAJ4486986.1 hypothetical protein C8R41DRAFT_837488 [Lentinula lateritia]
MPFPFTFTFSLIVPGLSNPFSAPPLYPYQQNQRNEAGPSTTRARGRSKFVEQEDGLNISNTPNHMNSRRRVSPSPVGAGNSRKRGWEPAFAAEPSLAPTFVTVSNGYLDTPAKLAVAKQTENGLHAREQAVVDEQLQHPPAKRRRTLAGSIVSTAVNAALVGTAVGLTVYRLWRDRGTGKGAEQRTIGETSPSPPPPPYSPPSPDVNVIPPTPRTARKSRRPHEAHSTRRRPARKVLHNIASFGPSTSGSQSALFPPTQPEFDFSPSSVKSSPRRNREQRRTHSPAFNNVSPDHLEDLQDAIDPDTDDQMDQIDSLGSKLSFLIEQGKRALGREIVVMSEVEEDAVDDGSGAWIEEDQEGEFGKRGTGRLSRSGSASRRRTAGSASSATVSLGRRAGVGMNVNPPPYGTGLGIPSSALPPSSPSTPPASLPTFESSWESPELKETMERARAIVRQRKSMNFRTDTGS